VIYPTGYMTEHKVDEKGRILEVSDGFGLQKGYDYDASGQVQAVRTAIGTTRFTYDDRGNLKSIVDPRGLRTSYSYDSRHNLEEVVDAEKGVSSYEYSSSNQLVSLSLPNGSCKTLEYDSYGRLCREIWGR
jgi:YD repeat-containing protein